MIACLISISIFGNNLKLRLSPYCGCVLSLLLFLCLTVKYVEDTIVTDNYTFTIPKGYTLMENDTQLIMYNDN